MRKSISNSAKKKKRRPNRGVRGRERKEKEGESTCS
jgi:hypothetical protein